MKRISVVITNWNGQKLLERNLETVIKNSPQACEVVVADDASTDSSPSFVSEMQKKHPQLKLFSHTRNLGFAINSNLAVRKAVGDYIVLLNNDIFPRPFYLSPSLSHFSQPQLFGVGFAEFGLENYPKIFWSDGYIQYQPCHSSKTHISGWLSGGSSIITKSIFLKLGGFDQIYAPFYSEDLDLGYRAWKSAYRCLWEPKSLVDHRHASTISLFPKRYLDQIKERNRLLTVWRNITNPNMLRQNRNTLILRCLYGPNYLKIILAAKRRLASFPPPRVYPRFSDQQIFNFFN